MVVKFKLCNMDTMCETYGEATVENGKATNIKIDNADKFLRYGYEIFALNKQLLATFEEDIKNGDVILQGIEDFPMPKIYFWQPIYIGDRLAMANIQGLSAFGI